MAAEAGGRRVAGDRLDLDFPDYRSLIRLRPTHRVELPTATLRRAVADGATCPYTPATPDRSADQNEVPVTVLAVSRSGELRVVESEPGTALEDTEAADGDLRVAVNQEFLLEALAAGAPDQLVLELGGAIGPLAIRSADQAAGNFSVLMPIRLT